MGSDRSVVEPSRTPTRFLVEVHRPGLGFQSVGVLAERADAGAKASRAKGGNARFIRAITVPEDGSCLLLFEALESTDVEDVVRGAVIEFERVTPVITLPVGLETPDRHIVEQERRRGITP